MVLFALGLGVVLGFLGSIPAAGPLLLLVIASGLEGRRRSALSLASGGALAESIYVALAFWGFAAVLDAHPHIVVTLRVASVVLLTVLGLWLVFKRRTAGAGPDAAPVAGNFATGFMLVALNPAFLATWSAVAAVAYGNAWLSADARRVPWLALGSFAGIVLWFLLVATLAHRHRERFRAEVLEKMVRGLGVAILAIAAWLSFSLLR
ncbi:MAG: LysE family transporter [Myxococcales bacterium]|nr:LysE family transporter [Myxococcales bacterium]